MSYPDVEFISNSKWTINSRCFLLWVTWFIRLFTLRKYNIRKNAGVKLHQKHIFYSIKEEGRERKANSSQLYRETDFWTPWVTVSKSSRFPCSSLHIWSVQIKKTGENIINRIIITALHWVNILLAHKVLHSVETTKGLGLCWWVEARRRTRTSVPLQVSAGRHSVDTFYRKRGF